uniref:Reverse transcriptase n=1 Tax=Tanacetum cinerariifolium TaxID=118510 RepID=A0A6L2KTZ5_TANCI|nr:reverse transcriptase [Tanacetum cinerariifolium]
MKGKFYRMEIKPYMLYGSECWPITKALANRMEIAELRMLRWTCGKTMLDMVPNGVYRVKLEVETIINKMREGRLRWFRHVRRRPQLALVRRVETLVVDGLRRKDRTTLKWQNRIVFPLLLTMINAPPENCLLGKVIANNHIVHKQSVISILRNAWKNHNSVTISPWKNNFFKFAFENKEDIPKILRDSPWSVMGYYVALVPWDSSKTLDELEFNRGEFWIQVHDLPLGMLSSEYATELAKSLGKLIELDCVGEGPKTDRDFLRFRVELDITKPLVPGFFSGRPQPPVTTDFPHSHESVHSYEPVSSSSPCKDISTTTPLVCSNYYVMEPPESTFSPTPSIPPSMTIDASLAASLSKLALKRKHDEVPSSFTSDKRMKCWSRGSYAIGNQQMLQTTHANATQPAQTEELHIIEELKYKKRDSMSINTSKDTVSCSMAIRPPPTVVSERKRRGRSKKNNVSDNLLSNILTSPNLIELPIQMLESVSNLRELHKAHSPDVIFLMETKNKQQKLERLRRSLHFASAYYVDPVGCSGGLALWWTSAIDPDIVTCNKNLIITQGKVSRGAMSAYLSHLSMCFVYAPHDRVSRAPVWDAIVHRSSSYVGHCLIIGDFNLIGELSDKVGGSSGLHHVEEFQQFTSAGLIDIPYTGLKYTWSNQRNEGDNIRERIDRALGNINLFEACPFQSLLHKPLIGSDHAPLIYSSHPTHQRKKSRFHFEYLWTTHEECENTIRGSWPTLVAGNQLLGIKRNFSKCASRLKRWSQVTFGNNKRNINNLTREIEMVESLPYTPRNFHRQRMLLQELETTWLREEMYWHQRSRVNWLNYEDREWVYDKRGIERLVRDHFQSIYMTNGARDFEDVISVLDRVVSESMNIHLQSPVTHSEIHKATIQLCGLKAPGKSSPHNIIHGRQIQDSIVVANEALHYIRNKKCGKQNVIALKVDINKAFDRVEWDFLLAVLQKMGFGDLWCNWISACLTTYELEFMVNGDSVGVIKPQRGLRQRDPISPYLFIIIVDVLSRQISTAMTLGTLSGIKMTRNCPLISHIFFADDSLFFLKASHGECGTLISILYSYCEASGQTVNFQKSSAFFSLNTPSSLRDDIYGDLHVHQMDCKAKYLGLPSIFGQKKAEMFGFLLMKGWKHKLPSQSRREVIIKSVIQAIPTYAMQCFLLPSSLLNKLTTYVRRFFWGGDSHEHHIHWKNWKKLLQPKQQGSLGFRNVEAFNRALLAKQGWRLLINPDAFWGRILKGIYFSNLNFLVAKKGSHLLALEYDDFYIPSPLGPFHNNNTVSDFIEDGHWNVRKLREHISASEAEMVLQIPISQTGSSDKLIWHFDPKGQYTVKSGYKQAMALMSTSVFIGESSANPSSKFWMNQSSIYFLNVHGLVRFGLALPYPSNLLNQQHKLEPAALSCRSL